MDDELCINDLRVRTLVGFSAHEVGKIQEVDITAHMMVSLREEGNTDKLHSASVDLKTVCKAIIALVEVKKYQLIESIATDVARICVMRHGVSSVRVTVKKPGALRFADSSSVTISRTCSDFRHEEVHVSIGSNINGAENIPKAIEMLKKRCNIVRVSKAFVTAPKKCSDSQDDFINMAVLLETKLDHQGLKLFLYEVENELGRTQDPSKRAMAPREIDLDISLWGEEVFQFSLMVGGGVQGNVTKTWHIPEEDITEYAHVVVPLADISPSLVHPITKQTLESLARQVTGRDQFRSFFPTVDLPSPIQLQSPIKFGNGARIHNAHESFGENVPVCRVNVDTSKPVALVTGASKRIGACIARKLHNKGYNIVIHYNTSAHEAVELMEDLNSNRESSAHCFQADLQTNVEATARQLVDQVTKLWGRLDVLVNNASIFPTTVVGNITEDEWNEIIQTNLTAPFFLSQAAYELLKSSRGSIINLTDIYASRPRTNYSVYCISKAGLEMATLTLAKDFAPHVRVNAIAPGVVIHPERKVVDQKELQRRKEMVQRIPLQESGSPQDVATAVEYLVCGGKYVTGQILNVDGGMKLNL